MKSTKKSESNKTKRKHAHPYKSYLREIRPVWKKNPELVRNMIMDMVEKKDRLIERSYTMEFVERFLAIHRNRVSKVHPKELEELFIWVQRQRIQYLVNVYLWIRNFVYDSKFWISDDYELKYLDQQIELRTRYLQIKRKKDDFHIAKEKIVNQLQKGNFPDTAIYDPLDIGRVFGWIQHIEILKEKRKELLKTKSITTVNVPVELTKDEQTHEFNLQVSIPPDFIKSIQQETIREELKSFKSHHLIQAPEPKLFTRSETSEIMQISLPTLDELTKKGTIKCYRIGDTNMKRYRLEDIQAALVKIETEYRRRPGMRSKSN